MSFLISFNGQFKPYTLPERYAFPRRIHTNKASTENSIDEAKFDNSQKPSQLKNNTWGISQYKKNERKLKNFTQIPYAFEIMSKGLVTARPESTLKEMYDLMKRSNIHHLPILDQEKILRGIVSDRDLINRDMGLKAQDIMQTEVLVCNKNTKIQILASIMLHENLHSIPILNDDYQLIGIVTQTDLLKTIMQVGLINE